MTRAVWGCLLSIIALLAAPVVAHAATVTVANSTITFTAGAGEANTAVIVKQQTTPAATIYFVGDQNPNVTVTASAAQGCLPTPPGLGLPKGYLCTVTALTPITSVVENLGDRNDTGVVNMAANGPRSTIIGGPDDDTLVGGRENDTSAAPAATTASPTSASPPPASRARSRSTRRCRRAPSRRPATGRRARTTRLPPMSRASSVVTATTR